MTEKELFPIREVLAVSNAAYRKNGNRFVKMGTGPTANKDLIYCHFYGKWNTSTRQTESCELVLTEEDYDTADHMLLHFKGLSFKAINRSLTKYETAVLDLVSKHEIDKTQLGIAAALPENYSSNVKADEWADREREISENSDYVGVLNSRCDAFDATVQFIRHITVKSTGAKTKIFSVTDDDGNLVKFFSDMLDADVGDRITVAGFVKKQEVSDIHNGKETMLNRITAKRLEV